MSNPADEAYLTRSYFSRKNQKGGTLIVEEVVDREEHHRRLYDPDGYRPSTCKRCNGTRLHAHDFRERRTRGDPESAVEQVRRYLCASCKAVWTVLPGILARCLHRSWETIQSALVQDGFLKPTGEQPRVLVPLSTRRRWRVRLHSSAKVLIQVLTATGSPIISVLRSVSESCTRVELIEALLREGFVRSTHRLAECAAFIHRLVPGIRLM